MDEYGFCLDALHIKSLDRLGRNKQMILDEWRELAKVKRVDIKFRL